MADDKDIIGYPDLNGVLWPAASQAIRSNQCSEGDMSRSASGGCPQDADNVPDK